MVEDWRSKLTRHCLREYGWLQQTTFPESQELFGEDPQGLLDSVANAHNRAQNRSKGANGSNGRSGRKASFGGKGFGGKSKNYQG